MSKSGEQNIRLIRALPQIWAIVTDQSELFPQIWVNPVSDIFSALQCNNIYARGRANLLFPARLKPQKWVYLTNTFLAPVPRGVAALVPVSDDKIQITLLILGRDALSTHQFFSFCKLLFHIFLPLAILHHKIELNLFVWKLSFLPQDMED